MRRWAHILMVAAVAIWGAGAAAAWPGPQILRTDDPAVPGAVEVLSDTPNAHVWSRSQVGRLGEWRYRLYPDGSAVVMPDGDARARPLHLDCIRGDACHIWSGTRLVTRVPATASPRPLVPDAVNAETLARYLAEWVLAGSGPEHPIAARPVDAGPPMPARQRRRDGIVPPLARDGYRLAMFPATSALCLSGGTGCDVPASAQPPADLTELARRLRLSCGVTAGAALRSARGDGGLGPARVTLGCAARLSDRFTLNLGVTGRTGAGRNPDVTYALTWRAMDRLSLSYASKAIRLDGSWGGLLDGRLRADLTLPRIPLPAGRGADCRMRVALPDPTRDALVLSCGVRLTERLSLGLSAHAYAAGVQRPWDPDYTYSATWKVTERLRVSYANHAANRFPWNRGDGHATRLRDGTLSLTYDLSF